jgi:molybdenum cofactor biosynthesis enzyme MoaA
MQDLRRSILEGRVHRLCQCQDCPFQQAQPAFPVRKEPIQADESLAREFDEEWYLQTHQVVREAVAAQVFVSGLEHFIRHGRADGAAYRLRPAPDPNSPIPNAIMALIEYSRGEVVVRNTPVDIIPAVTTICNLRCGMCPHGMRLVENPHQMPVGFVERAADYMARASRMAVSGLGEPTLSDAFWMIIRLVASRSDLFIRVNSNAHFITEENAPRILDSGLTEISFSLDAFRPETYALIRAGDFERAKAGVARLTGAKRRRGGARVGVYINMTLMQANLPEAGDFVRLGASLGVDGVIFTQIFSFGDRPEWRVPREQGLFVYSEQMPSRNEPAMRRAVADCLAASQETGVSVILRDNVVAYRSA